MQAESEETRQYASFVIRCWRLTHEERRIKIEHLQSGEVVQVLTLPEAVAWLEAHWEEPQDKHEAHPDQAKHRAR